jgi:predicted double-glycine peptidase
MLVNLFDRLNPPVRATTLEVPLRMQDPESVYCGAASLGMAFDYYETKNAKKENPNNDRIIGWMKSRNLFYDFGTGAEELTYTAREMGYTGSYNFCGWATDKLAKELREGHPVTIAIKLEGYAQSTGHFITITGVSADNKTFAFNDPLIGETHISAEKLNAVWQANGGCGLVVLPEPLPDIPASSAPLFAGAAALATLAALGALGTNRKGIGGALPDMDGVRRWWNETQSASETPSTTVETTPSASSTSPQSNNDPLPQSGGSGSGDSGDNNTGSDERRNRFDWEAWLEQEKARFAQALNEAKGQAKTEAESAFAKYQKMKDETWASREDEAMPVDYWEIVKRLQEEEKALKGYQDGKVAGLASPAPYKIEGTPPSEQGDKWWKDEDFKHIFTQMRGFGN